MGSVGTEINPIAAIMANNPPVLFGFTIKANANHKAPVIGVKMRYVIARWCVRTRSNIGPISMDVMTPTNRNTAPNAPAIEEEYP